MRICELEKGYRMIRGLASAFYENWISVEKVKKVQFGKRKSEKCILGNAGLQTSNL
jgi:hypothetical protein